MQSYRNLRSRGGSLRLFERVRAVERNEEKAASNRRKHVEAIEVFYGTSLLRRSDRKSEERWLAIGETEGRIVAVVFRWRGDPLRLISARPARRNEKRAYHREKMGRTPKRGRLIGPPSICSRSARSRRKVTPPKASSPSRWPCRSPSARQSAPSAPPWCGPCP
jgi:uncharacterized protein